MYVCDEYDMDCACEKFQPKTEPYLLKRENEWEKEIKKEEVDVNAAIPRDYGDRFIPRRYPNMASSLNTEFNRQLFKNGNKTSDFMVAKNQVGYWRSSIYSQKLRSVIGLEPGNFYQLSDPIMRTNLQKMYSINPKSVKITRTYPNTMGLDWHCKPRLQPMAYLSSTHELPGYKANFCANILSWSKLGPIAACFENNLVLWFPESMNTLVFKLTHMIAIAYSPSGRTLAVSCKEASLPKLELWDCSRKHLLYTLEQYVLRDEKDLIECIDWQPSGKYIACGTVSGNVLIFVTPGLRQVREMRSSFNKIFSVRFSPNEHWLAAQDNCGNTTIWRWNTSTIYAYIKKSVILNSCMAWHPWNGNDLFIAQCFPARIDILNLPTKKFVASYECNEKLISFNAISFNNISAELLVSISVYNANDNMSPTHEVIVLASLDRVVDVLGSYDDLVSFMIWSPDGKQLATVSDDDALFLWHFFIGKYKIERKDKIVKCFPKKPSKLFGQILDAYSIR